MIKGSGSINSVKRLIQTGLHTVADLDYLIAHFSELEIKKYQSQKSSERYVVLCTDGGYFIFREGLSEEKMESIAASKGATKADGYMTGVIEGDRIVTRSEYSCYSGDIVFTGYIGAGSPGIKFR